MCARRRSLLAFALLCLSAVYSSADISEAVELITQARLRLTALGLSLQQREADLTGRESLIAESRTALESERLELSEEKKALSDERLSIETEKADLSERERILIERELSLPRVELQLKILTDSYGAQSKSLARARLLNKILSAAGIISLSVAGGAVAYAVLF